MHIDLYIATHKKIYQPADSIYKVIQVGSSLSKSRITEYIQDDTLDNISALNKSFCELTALYWMWKNTKSDFLGLNHYRRYFCAEENIENSTFFYKNQDITVKKSIANILSTNEAINYMKNYDIIVPEKTILPVNNFKQYSSSHNADDVFIASEIIRSIHPKYGRAFDFFMNSNKIMLQNIFLSQRNIFQSYCSWVFDILFKMKDMKFYRNYDEYQYRIFGFLAERLFNIWFLVNRKDFLYIEKNVITVDVEIN